MQLNMQNIGGVPQNLSGGDNTIVTGPMGDCVSVVVLWNFVGAGYTHTRGWHGLGGVQAVDMAAMMAGVPNNVLTQVILIPGSLQQSNYARNSILEYVDNAIAGTHPAVMTRFVAGRSNVSVNRQSQIANA